MLDSKEYRQNELTDRIKVILDGHKGQFEILKIDDLVSLDVKKQSTII